MFVFKQILAGAVGLLAIAGAYSPASATEFWWPKGGEEARYDLLVDGEKVGRSTIAFAYDDDGYLRVTQDQNLKAEMIPGLDASVRTTFREMWKGQDFWRMTTYGQIKTAAGSTRMKVVTNVNDKGKQTINSKLGDRVSEEVRVPATFWHINQLTYSDVFDPYVGGFAQLAFVNNGPQLLEVDEGQKQCLSFDLNIHYIDHKQFVKTALGPDPEDVPLDRTFKAWFEPTGLMCALSFETPVGTVLLIRDKVKM